MTVSKATLRRAGVILNIKWNGVSYVNESAYVISIRGDQRMSVPGEGLFATSGLTSEVVITLANVDGRFSALNTSSPLYPYIKDGLSYQKECTVQIVIDGAATLVFTGTIKAPNETGRSVGGVGTVEIKARSSEGPFIQRKETTTFANFVDYRDTGYNEGELITKLLSGVGLTDGIDFTSQAFADAWGGTPTIDPGLFIIPWFWLDDESVIEECWKLASACGGRFYADPANGKFYYRNAQSLALYARSSVVQATIDWDMYNSISLSYDDKELYNEVTVVASPRSLGEQSILWEPDEPIRVNAGETITVTANLSKPVYAYDSYAYVAVTSGGMLVDTGVTLTPTYYAQRVDFSITNTNAYMLYLRNFKLIGRSVEGGPSIERTATSSDSFWNTREARTRTIGSNVYIQTTLQADFLSNLLLNRQQNMVFKATIDGFTMDPSLNVGDLVTVVGDELGSSFNAIISAITWSFSYGNYTAKLDVYQADNLYKYGNPNTYIVIGTDLFNTTKVLFV